MVVFSSFSESGEKLFHNQKWILKAGCYNCQLYIAYSLCRLYCILLAALYDLAF